jgi:uncharacterized membrane protein YkvA (DUF1232 family)
VAKVTKEQAREELNKRANQVKGSDVEKILAKRDEIEQKFSGSGVLGKFIADIKILYSMIQDYWDGSYREVPWTTIAAAVAALAYVLSPIDLVPDFIPFLGLVDDALVVGLCLSAIDSDLQSYVRWKKRQVTLETA